MDPFDDLPRLPDPLADAVVPGPDDPQAVSLFEEVLLMSNPTPDRRYRRPLLVVAAAAVVAVVVAGAVVLPFGTSTPSASAVALEAIEATELVTSGTLVRDRTAVAGPRTQSTEVTIAFDGDDIHLTNRSEGSIIDDTEGQFTPDLLEVITVDGNSYIRLEPMQPEWTATERSPMAGPSTSVGEQLRALIDAAPDFDRCESTIDGIDAFCVSTTDPTLVEAFEVEGIRYTEIEADLRIEIDTSTGLLHRLVLDGRDAIVDPIQPELVIPALDSVEAVTTFEGLGEPVSIIAP